MNIHLYAKLALFFAVFVVSNCNLSYADIVIDVGTHEIRNRENQTISLEVFSSAPATDPVVSGFNFRAQIGNGLDAGVEPTFSEIVFGGIWTAFDTTVVGGPVEGAEQYAQASVVFENSGDFVSANGQLVTLTIDASNIDEGTFDLLLTGTDIGAPSDFILGSSNTLTPVIINGTLQVTNVPEPGAIALLGSAFSLVLIRRRR